MCLKNVQIIREILNKMNVRFKSFTLAVECAFEHQGAETLNEYFHTIVGFLFNSN